MTDVKTKEQLMEERTLAKIDLDAMEEEEEEGDDDDDEDEDDSEEEETVMLDKV